jgi:hypothetical protein
MNTQSNFPTISALSDTWTLKDYWGVFKVRWGVGRFSYRVAPGLYALGTPGEETPVFVTANYKLSVDHLRRALRGRDAWILVLDTKGINVWCAAGKGTFGTEELIHRLQTTGLRDKKGKKLLILPQLGAPGVSAPAVEKATGFRVIYGTIRAKDIPEFLDSGLQATEQMRTVTFSLLERLILIPVELKGLIVPIMLLLSILSLAGAFLAWGISFLGSSPISLKESLSLSVETFFPLIPAGFLGVILFPILLPLLPGKAFSVKGAVLASLGLIAYLTVSHTFLLVPIHSLLFKVVPYIFLLVSMVSFLALNFTGSTPFTSLSGVLQEMRIALPVQLVGFLVGTVWLWIDLVTKRGIL